MRYTKYSYQGYYSFVESNLFILQRRKSKIDLFVIRLEKLQSGNANVFEKFRTHKGR